MQSKVKLPVYDKTLLNLYSLYKVYVYLVRKEEKKKISNRIIEWDYLAITETVKITLKYDLGPDSILLKYRLSLILWLYQTYDLWSDVG